MLPFFKKLISFALDKHGPLVQWIEWRIPVPLIGVRVPTGSQSQKPKTLKSVFWVLFLVVIPTGLEPISKEPESFILSIELGDHVYRVQS